MRHKDWTLEDWKNVIWSDETSVVIGMRRGSVRVWRQPKEKYDPSCVRNRWKGFSDFMFWGCFSYDSKGPCHIYKKETPKEMAESVKEIKQLKNEWETTWRTTRIAVLHRESGIPPASILLEGIRLPHAARLHRLDACHPLRMRAASPSQAEAGMRRYRRPELHDSRAQRTYALLPGCGPPPPAPKPPAPGPKAKTLGKKSTDIDHLAGIGPLDRCVYSGGSSVGRGRSAWGYTVQQADQASTEASGPLPGEEVFDAEVEAAVRGLQTALFTADPDQTRRFIVLVDNQAAVRSLTTRVSSSSSHRARAFRAMVDLSPLPVEVRWIPGHKGIAGNERADRLAKAALRDLAGMDTEIPRSHACQARLARQRRQDLVEKWWADNAPDAYRALGLEMRRRKPPELCLARRTLHKLLAARTGHGDFAAYRRRFNHPDANLLCHCGQEKSPVHFLHCRASPTARANSHRALSGLIESHLGPRAFENFPKALGQD